MKQENILLNTYKNKYLNKNIEFLNLENNILLKLKENNINTIEEIWKTNRKSLKKNGLTDSEINQIAIKLQLLSLDLNKKIYNN